MKGAQKGMVNETSHIKLVNLRERERERQINEENPPHIRVKQSQKTKQDATVRGIRDFFYNSRQFKS